MQQDLNNISNLKLDYIIGDPETLNFMQYAPPNEPFSENITEFLNTVSRTLLNDTEAKTYPDITTLAFWIRKASVAKLSERFKASENTIRLGKGIVFHIAPSNVPVNFAYSLFTGLMCGNANIVRIPAKDFPQVSVICRAVRTALVKHPYMQPYIILVRYGHDKDINGFLSSLADVRVIWGGDDTINTIRQFSLKPRASEITFADRYSISVIDSDAYLSEKNKAKVASDFYNDTYLTDQNACTSPRAVVWTGKQKETAKNIFWNELHSLAEKKYELKGIQAVNKLTSSLLLAAKIPCKKNTGSDNLTTRMQVGSLTPEIMKLKDNSGYFFEYDCDDILLLKDICSDAQCQTISYYGDKKILFPLLKSGLYGVDRIVPIGRTMDFDLIWDGYNLVEQLTRNICL